MPQGGPARLAASPPACDGATVVLRGSVRPGLVQQQSERGAHGRCKAAWLTPRLATSEGAELRFGSTARSDRSMERRPANFNFDRCSASYKRWPRRCDGFRAYSIASARKPAQQLDRRRQSCKRSAAYADANAAARAPRTVRSDSTNVVVPLVQDELQAWPARCAC